jgi:hypothetical protein
MSAGVQPISEVDSLALLRQRMIREVEIFLEWSIARGGTEAGRRIPTGPTRSTAPGPASPARPVGGWASWYHGPRSCTAGEAGPC